MTRRSCHWCEFAHQKGDENECRRRSPLATGGLHGPAFTHWPLVSEDDWCGDFKDAGRPVLWRPDVETSGNVREEKTDG